MGENKVNASYAKYDNLQDWLTVVALRVGCARVKKLCVPTGDLKAEPGAQCDVLCESGGRGVCSRRLDSQWWGMKSLC